jgi:tetratricopeptide (TPR) repeat protein
VSTSAPNPIDFALRFVDGRGVLDLRAPQRLDWVDLERLELEIPNLRFPFDVSGGAARFQTRRCHLSAAQLVLDEAALQEWMARRPQLGRFGLSQPRVHLRDGRVLVAARARVADREATVTVRLSVGSGSGQMLRAYVASVRMYGFLPAPAPLIGMGLLYSLGASADAESAARLDGLDVAEVNPLELLLWKMLPPAGWRMPRFADATTTTMHIGDGRMLLRFGAGDPVPVESHLEDVHRRAAEGDARLLSGDLPGALEVYRRVGGLPEIEERALSVLAAMPGRFGEALDLGRRLVNEMPDRPERLVALAAVEAERGELATAAEHFARAAELAEESHETEDALAAALAAGEAYAGSDNGAAATRWLERVVSEKSERGPALERAVSLLADRYADEQRWQELLQLEKRRLTFARGERQEAAARARLGRLWLERIGDPVRGRDELERALRLDGQNARVWRLYARALDEAGDGARALEALGRAAQLTDDTGERSEAHLSAANVAERIGSLESALDHTREALSRTPSHPGALARAASLLTRLGRLEDAVATYERAVEAAPDDETRARLLYELAWLARDTLKDPRAARGYVDRSLSLNTTAEALRLASGLAEQEGRLDDLARLLGAQAERGDRGARLSQARVLLALGRAGEAAEAAEAVTAVYPREALVLLADARQSLGQLDHVRAALERLVAEGGADANVQVKLARLLWAEGELDRARLLLDEALGHALGHDAEKEALEILCDVLLRQGDDAALDRALGRLAAAREDGPQRSRALSAQGAARARLGLSAEAAESYRAALALSPEDPQALAGLGEAAYALRRWDEARAALEPLHRRGLPPRVERALRLGELADKGGQSNDAIGFYQAALDAGASGSDAQRAYNALIAQHHAKKDADAEARVLIAAVDDERLNESAAARAGRLVTAADLLRKRLERPDEARRAYERALTLDPLHLAALDALESLAENIEDWEEVANILSRKVAATHKRPAQQKAILGRLARLQDDKLGRPDAAREAYGRALAIDPDFRPALIYLVEEARRTGDRDEELQSLERLVQHEADLSDGETRPNELTRLGQLYLAAGRAADAEASARKALELSPRHGRALALLDDLLTRAGQNEALLPLLQQRASLEANHDQGFELWSRRAALLDQMGRRGEAILAWQELTQLRPGAAAAWTRLAALLREDQKWGPLCDALGRLAESHAAEGRRAEAEGLFVEISHLAHDKLGDLPRARAMLERALEVQPRSKMAISGLLTLARARGDVGEEDALLGKLAETESDALARALTITDRARARLSRGDSDGALALLGDVDSERAPDATLRLRVEIAEEHGRLHETAAALESLRMRARAARDAVAERFAVKRLARLAAAQGPSGAAEELLRRAVELDPDDRDSARALADVEKARGDDLAYLHTLDQLLRTARRTFEGAAREAQLCVEMAEVLRRVGDLEGAQARLREALDAAPDDGAAWRLYGSVLGASGATPESARAMRKAAELGGLGPLGWVELAKVHEDLGDHQLAAEAYAKAGEAAPIAARAMALERVGKDDDALLLWRQLDDKEAKSRVAMIARRKAARAYSAGKFAEARAGALEALAGDPDDTEALGWALHGLAAGDALATVERLSETLPAPAGAALLRWAADRFDGDEARQALERAVQLAPDASTLVALGAQEGGARAVARYRQALELDPACAEAAFGLVREGDPHEAARTLNEVHDRVTESHGDRRVRAQLSAALGALHRDKLANAAGAREAYRRAVEESAPLEPWRGEALRSLASLEQAGGDALAAEEALERLRAESAATDADTRHLAELYLERGAPDDALKLLRNLPGSSELLLRALEATGEWPELARLLEEQAPRKMPAEARGFLMRAAQIYAGPLVQPEHAAELLERAVPLGPSEPELWARLGSLYSGPLGEPERGARAWARAWGADRNRVDLLYPLAKYHLHHGEWEPARDYLEEALARGAVGVTEVGEARLQLAEIARRRLDPHGEEQQLWLAAEHGQEEAAWTRLGELYRGRGDRAKLASTLRKLAGKKSGAQRAALLREALPFLAQEDLPLAEEEILEADPRDVETQRRVFERLRLSAPQRLLEWVSRLRREGVEPALDPAAQRAVLRAERRYADLLSLLDVAATQAQGSERERLELEAIELNERELARPGEAARRLGAFIDKSPTDRALLARARRLYASAGEPIYALSLLEKELALADADDAAQLKIARGELLLLAGADAEAEAEFLHALITTPRVGRAHAALAEVYKRRGDLAGALEHLIAAADAPDLEPPRAAACAVDAADVLLKEGDNASAERLYQLAAALDPADRRAVDGLIRLAAARGDHERQADLLGRAAALTADRRERARLALHRARLFQTELGRELDAYRAYKEAVACDPSLRDAARGLRALAESRGEWALAAELVYRELSSADDAERVALHVELGRLLEEKLLEQDEALRNYEQASELAKATGRAAEAPFAELIRLYANLSRFGDAAKAAEELASALPSSRAMQRAESLARAGELWEKSGDSPRARARLAEAAAIGGEAGKRADETLLRLTAQAGDTEELRRRIEERLAIEPEGELRLELLRRLLQMAVQAEDLVEMDVRSQEVLARAPDDPMAFVARKRVLEERSDDAGALALLRARAGAVPDLIEQSARRFEAGRLCERLYDVSGAAADYEAALVADPENVAALDALADLAYRTRHLSRARALYAQLADRSGSLGGSLAGSSSESTMTSALPRDEICRRRAELAEAAGDLEEAGRLYVEAIAANPSDLAAHEALARLALSRGDDNDGYTHLRTVLDLLPLDAVDRITELRRQLGELAVRLGQREAARGYYELVLAQDPARRDALEALVQIYLDLAAWEEAADTFSRLSQLAEEPAQRAELLFRRGEVLRQGLGDLERANDSFLKAADLHPAHAPTLRRLVSYYYHEGDHGSLAEVVRDLEAIGATLEEAAVHAGLGIALGGDEARGTVVVAVAQPSAARLAEALAAAKIREMAELDAGLRVSMRALGGGDAGRVALVEALREALRDYPEDLGARLALARIHDQMSDLYKARVHYGVLAFVDGNGLGAHRLKELGPPTPLTVDAAELVHPSARGPLREALAALAPHVLGLPPSSTDADAAPAWTERLRPIAEAAGIRDFEAAVVVHMNDPAWAEPTRPARLLLLRRALGDEAVARFAAARALFALQSGVPLVEGRSPSDVLALVRAAALLFLPDLSASRVDAGAFVHAWQAELVGMGLKPEQLGEGMRSHIEAALAACVVDSTASAAAAHYAVNERLSADRAALAITGDLRAGLVALCPVERESIGSRAEALAEVRPLAELVAFASQLA